eukprot:TRINITY_DN4233_c0_g1_i1.p1 TRINITY_DN4233_c0_g1~~TRINITY_DN4233_c0_g1_i1.p1  ORF type:complete len:443 (+),score=168.76 TRINITY_DN4233_c0_g1_i1:71-1399(+)
MPASERIGSAAALRAEQAALSALLARVAADVGRAAELAASVQRRLADALEARAEQTADSSVCSELERVFESAEAVCVELMIGAGGERAVVELPLTATVAELKAAAHEAGGPPPVGQLLSVGGSALLYTGSTPLSHTLVRPGIRVAVRRRDIRRKSVSVGLTHGVAILEAGEVVCWGAEAPWAPIPDFAGRPVTSVHAAVGFTAAVAGGRLRVWGHEAGGLEAAAAHVTDIVCCCVRPSAGFPVDVVLAVVDACGNLSAWNRDAEPFAVPAALAGRVTAVSIGDQSVVPVITREGSAFALRPVYAARRLAMRRTKDFGGAKPLSVSAGTNHYAVLLDDGTVRCFGGSKYGQCEGAPSVAGAVACECARNYTAALLDDGSLRCWGDVPPKTSLPPAGCVAVAPARGCIAVVAADGKLHADGDRSARHHCLHRPPRGRVDTTEKL